MQLKQLLTEDRAVSPVIAVVLMIAVTVILAAIVAAFATGMGTSTKARPTASLEFSYNGSNTTIVHEGGDTLQASRVTVLKNGTAAVTTNWAGGDDTIDVGESTSLSTAPGAEVRVVWEYEGQTATISEFEVPS